MKKFTVKIIIRLIIIFSFLGNINLFSQTCGSISRINSKPSISSILSESSLEKYKLKDRFGNEYLFDDLKIKGKSSISIPGAANTIQYSCNAGLFNLEFVQEINSTYGFSNIAHRDVVCQVFTDISRLLHDINPSNINRVNLLIASEASINTTIGGVSMSAGANSVGSSFNIIDNSLNNAFIDNATYSTIKNGKNSYENLINNNPQNSYDFYHGVLLVNFSSSSYYTNLNGKTIASNQTDLYSIVLHEAMHILGLTSFLDQNGNSIIGNKLFSRYDNFLYKSTLSQKLLNQNASNYAITKTVSNLALSCTSPNNLIFNGTSLTNQPVFTNSIWQNGVNLNHFGCSGSGFCSSSSYALPSNKSVLTPCSGTGINFLKRHPSQNEVYALCDLGYKLKAVSGVYAYGDQSWNDTTFGDIYQTYSSCTEPCIAVGGHDTFYRPYASSFTINYTTSILNNDIPTTSVVGRIYLLDTSIGSITTTSSGFTFIPNPNHYSTEINLAYFPKCNATGILGTATYITIFCNYNSVLPCYNNNECNYICNGTFEESIDPNAWSNFVVYDPHTMNTVDLYRNKGDFKCRRDHIQNYWHGCTTDSGCHFQTKSTQPSYNGGNQFIGMGANQIYSEGVHFKLRKPVFYDTTKSFHLKFQAKVPMGGCKAVKIYVVANDSAPLPRPSALFYKKISTWMCNTGYCPIIGSALIAATVNFVDYDIQISQPPLGDSFTDIIVYLALDTISPGEGAPYYAYFDNFELYDSLAPKVVISSNPSTYTPCTDTSHTINYTVCTTNTTFLNTDSITIQLNLPSGINIDSGSSFDSSGRVIIPKNTISNAGCSTLVLKYSFNTTIDYSNSYNIGIGYSSRGYCGEYESSLVKVYPINKSLTLVKTASNNNPAIGDTVTFNIQICNNSIYQSWLDLRDSLSQGMRLIEANGFLVNGNKLSMYVNMPASLSPTSLACISLNYKVVITSNCKQSSCATINSISNSCFKASSCLTLNSASTGSAVNGFITPVKAIWCGNPLTLTANVVNPSGTYTYQWQYNSTNISGATSSSYTATLNGIYGVNISQNGCSSQIISKSFDSSFTITKIIINPTCTASNGSITISPENGIKPYSYAWSGSTNTSNSRTGLIAGTYIVTITDSFGCSKVDTINLLSKTDTVLINKSTTKTICSANNGSITLNPTKGNAPFSYLWNNGSTLQNRTGLVAGTYKVTITDSLGCKLVDSMTIDSSQNTILANDSIIDNYCTSNSNGKIYLRPSGGIKPYQFLWNNGATTQNRIGLVSANYIVTITDSFGCSLIDTFTIDSISSTIKTNDSIVHAYCSINIGHINLNPSGGAKPYTFLWNNGDTTKNRTSLNAGLYFVTITDQNNCIKKDSFQINNLSSNIQLFSYVDQPICNGTGNIYVAVLSGGFAPYKYHWSNNKDTSFVLGVLPGSYSLSVIDNIGCFVVATFIVDTPLSLIKLNPIVTNTKCNVSNGSIKLKVSGGYPPYTYAWKNSSNTSDSMHNLSQGYYTVTVTDSTGCTVVDSFYVPLTPILLDAYVMGGCNINNFTDAKVHISDGDAPFTYLWNTGSTDSFVNGVNTITYPSIFVTITDKNGCSVVVSKLVSASAGSIAIGTGTAFPTSSSMKGVLTFGNKPAVSNKKFIINGTFLVDESSGFDNCDFEANPGSKIVVTDSLYFNSIYNYTTFSGCHFYTCGNQLWKGIELKHQMGINEGGLVIWACLIEDALYGVDVFSGPITGYDFVSKNCFIGLLNRDHVGTTCWRKMTFFGSGTGFIKQPYSNISNSFYSPTHDTIYRLAKKSFCGIEYNNTTYAFTRDVHKFYNMANGLVLNDVFSAHVDQSYFENMQFNGITGNGGLSTGLPRFLSNGAAIVLNNSGLASGGTAYIRGVDVNTSLIKNCKWGVIGNSGGFIDMANMKIDSCNYGVFLNYSSGLIQMNAINATSYGIRQELTNTPNIYAYIDNNIINTSNIGIGVYGNTSTSRPYFGNITGNSIYFKNSGTYGVDAMNINNIYVFQNYIEADMPGVISVGYNYENCINVQDEQNTFFATPGNRLKIRSAPSGMLPPYPIGYYYYFTEHMAKCNSADNVRTGVRYTGLCNNSTLIGTSFHNHDIGLKLDNTATLIDQINNGNAFLDTCNFEARSDQPSLTLTKFFVNPSSSSALWASPRHPTTPSDIFRTNTGVDNTDCNIPLPPQAPEAELRDKIRLALLQYDEFEPQMLWQNQAWLFNYLSHQDSLTDEETEYLTAMQGHNIEKLDRLTADERAIFDRALSTKEQIMALTNNLNINANLLAQYSQVNTDALDSAAYAQHRALIASAQTTFNQQSDLLNNLLALESSHNYLELDTLSTANGQIVPEFVTDSLEVVFNELYYNTYARNNYNLSAEELMSYRSIANQCPMLNANAVFRSRAIVQSQSDSTRFYDDAAICLAAGYEYKNQTYTKPVLKPKPKLDYQLFPNPAKNYTKILFAEIPIGDVKIEVYDVLGRSIISDKLELNSNYYELNTMILNSGIYMIKISINNQDLAPTKLKIEK